MKSFSTRLAAAVLISGATGAHAFLGLGAKRGPRTLPSAALVMRARTSAK